MGRVMGESPGQKRRLHLQPRGTGPSRGGAGADAPPWVVLVVDDDPGIHDMTELLLRDLTFQGRPFRLLGAASAAEARAVIASHPEIHVVLLDVVMETDDAGLVLVRDIRSGMGDDRLRIILRTGQPGNEPEHDIMARYDINDYRTKTELTAQRLSSVLIAALRSWSQIDTVLKASDLLEARVAERTRELEQARAFAERLVEVIPNPVWCRDDDGRYRLHNRAFRDFFAVGGSGHDDLPVDAPFVEADRRTDRLLLAGEMSRVEYEVTLAGMAPSPGGAEAMRTVMVAKGALSADDGRPSAVVGIITDISGRKAMERDLRHQADSDPLTGIANRRRFMEVAVQEMDRSVRYGRPLSVIMLDVDRFKTINDSFGHAFGDQVLRAVAEACRMELRDADHLGRLGGEEFGVLLPETGLEGALDLAARLRRAVAGIALSAAGVERGGGMPGISASLGVAARRTGETDFQHLLARADVALYRAKSLGRDRVEGD